jgi:hypothetical protein
MEGLWCGIDLAHNPSARAAELAEKFEDLTVPIVGGRLGIGAGAFGGSHREPAVCS